MRFSATAGSLVLLAAVAHATKTCPSPSASPADFAKQKFDYVIIGGGTAGLTVASRLAENPLVQVGLIEAGLFHPAEPLIDIPQNIGHASGNPNFDWSFLSVPQPGINGAQMAVPRGKLLGGSSALNFLAFNRASKPEYDGWSSFVSGGWNFHGLLPYFKRSSAVRQNQSNPFPGLSDDERKADFNPEFVGINGPIQTSFNDIYLDPVFPLVETWNTLGFPTNADPDNGTSAGVYNSRSSVDRSTGRRSYATQYYCRSVSRPNFHVLTGAQATKILLNATSHIKHSYTASGVNVVVNSTEYTVHAKKEVILSAGAIQTPQLLELSGIGNSTLLSSLNITTLIDLPGVGENLQDHLFTGAQYEVKAGVQTFDELRLNATFQAEQTALYNSTGTGLLAAIDATITFAPFQMFQNATQVKTLLEIFDASANATSVSGTLQPLQHKIQRQWIEAGTVPQVELLLFSSGQLPPLANISYITVLAGSLHPIARGSVHINTTDPLAHPVIDQNYLSNDFDVQTLLSGLKTVLQLENTAPLSGLIQSRIDPPAAVQSDADLISYLRTVANSGSHPSGTAPLGPKDQGGVIGGDLKVHGTTNLRVVDASIFPLIIGAHLQETTYAVAEKAADIIKLKL